MTSSAHVDTAGPYRMHLVWSASDEAQECWSSSQQPCSGLFPRGCSLLQNRLLRMQLVTALVWAIDSQEHGAGMHYSWTSSFSWHPYSAPTNLLLRWHHGLRTSAKQKTVYFPCRSKMLDGCFQEFHVALLGINLFEHADPLRSNNDSVSECRYSIVTSVGGRERSLQTELRAW